MPLSHDDPEATPFADLGDALSAFFDPDWYLSRYPDVAASGTEPLHHFVHYGAAENRDPNRFFDSAWYLAHYPDVANSGQHPLLHYLQNGCGRIAQPASALRCRLLCGPASRGGGQSAAVSSAFGVARGWLTEKPIAIKRLPAE